MVKAQGHERVCIGYGEHEGTCENRAGNPWSDHHCPRCHDLMHLAYLKRAAKRRLEKPTQY